MDEAFAPSCLNTWDSHYTEQKHSFSIFRETICSVYMPWRPEIIAGTDFSARIEATAFDAGTVGNLHLSPIIASRRPLEISNSADDCLFANYVVSGELTTEQFGQTHNVSVGDFIVHDASSPLKLVSSGARYNVLAFVVPKNLLSYIPNLEDDLVNIVIPGHSLMRPLASCLEYLTHNLATMRRPDIKCMFDACVSLFPVAIGTIRESVAPRPPTVDHKKLIEVLDYVQHNLSDHDLSPSSAAQALNISLRYVHKLFASMAMTFMSYVTEKRLERICNDLRLRTHRRQTIAAIAHRWGFRDFSTFFRVFKLRYRMSPRQFRSGL